MVRRIWSSEGSLPYDSLTFTYIVAMARHPFRKRYLALLALSTVAISMAAIGKPKAPTAKAPVADGAEPRVEAAAPVVDAKEEAPQAKGPTACPADMVLVEGEFCTAVKQDCVDWIEDPQVNPYARCRKFSEKVTCTGERVHMRYCMDKEEYSAKGEELPKGDVSWNDAKKTCEGMGKRLCQEKEWTFACEGEQMVPYPYGFERDNTACNFEKTDLVEKGELRDQREPKTANPRCMSPFGVHNMVGNIDEWVVLDKPHYSKLNNWRKMNSGLKGGWWGPLRNRCRPTTVDHDEVFHELQTGFRCCAEANESQKTASAELAARRRAVPSGAPLFREGRRFASSGEDGGGLAASVQPVGPEARVAARDGRGAAVAPRRGPRRLLDEQREGQRAA